jgi:hypothetical protein
MSTCVRYDREHPGNTCLRHTSLFSSYRPARRLPQAEPDQILDPESLRCQLHAKSPILVTFHLWAFSRIQPSCSCSRAELCSLLTIHVLLWNKGEADPKIPTVHSTPGHALDNGTVNLSTLQSTSLQLPKLEERWALQSQASFHTLHENLLTLYKRKCLARSLATIDQKSSLAPAPSSREDNTI